MDERLDRLVSTLHEHFLAYYEEFLSLAKRAPTQFVAGDWDQRDADDLWRVQLYRQSIDRSAGNALEILGPAPLDQEIWSSVRRRFQSRYADELATTYFTSVMRRVFSGDGTPIEFADDGIDLALVDSDVIVRQYPVDNLAQLGKVVLSALGDSVFSSSLSPKVRKDADLLVNIVSGQLPEGRGLRSLEMLTLPFFRGAGAYLVGRFRTDAEPVPVVISVSRSPEGVLVDAVLVGFREARIFLLSSTRSAFTVSTHRHSELYSFLQRLFPNENPAYILELIGFSQPAKITLLRQLRRRLRDGEQFEYIGTGPVDIVFGLQRFSLVFKVIRRDLPDREGAIHNFRRVHVSDRLGQVLDSVDFRNVELPRECFSAELLDLLEAARPEDVTISDTHIVLRRTFAVRRIVPVRDCIVSASPREVERTLLDVGWNIKHLAAMGFLPRSLGLEHFGLTTWNRVVYLNNAALIDIRRFHFGDAEADAGSETERLSPQGFERELGIPDQHRDVFRAVHGDMFLPAYWQDKQISVLNGQYPAVYPYSSRCRVEPMRFRCSVWDELQRMKGTAHQIHIVLDNLAIVDVELAGLSFLRLEVPEPSARVLVLEPIGPEIIAQLHRQFQDVTFDILQSESEVVESSGQWTPGIRGKLKALVQVRAYDYVIGYVNETFDEEFFRLAKLQGFLLLSTGTHNIDVAAATATHTVVTNAPGPTTTTVAEQNIGLILDAVYCRAVEHDSVADEHLPPHVLAHLMWLSLLRETLKLTDMFTFGASELYVRTGVADHATVYHDQVGQNLEAGIQRSLGVLGLSEVGMQIVELAIAHELSTIYVLEQEYDGLPAEHRQRLQEMLAVTSEVSQTPDLHTRLVLVSETELLEGSDYTFETRPDATTGVERDDQVHIDVRSVGVPAEFIDSASPVLGIQGLGRIGESVAQRAIVLGMDLVVHQRGPDRPKYRTKCARLTRLASHCARWYGRPQIVEFTDDKGTFFRRSNVVTTLSATTAETRGWVDQAGLSQLGTEAQSGVRVVVSVGKGLVDEGALLDFLRQNRDAEARLDVLVGEHDRASYLKLVGDDGLPLPNIRVTGHTAAAVREVRRLKVFKALDNLRNLIDGRIPPDIVNNRGKKGSVQRIVEIEGLKFYRMEVPSPQARVLVIEPLPPSIVLQLQQRFDDVCFDVLLAESELVETDGHWTPGINSRLNTIVAARGYDYCLGYCNADFDQTFFEQASLKGLILFATATHHIDLDAATHAGTVVANTPGFTTVAVTEQNICMAMEALYGRLVQEYFSAEAMALDQLDTTTPEHAWAIAQILWFMLLRRALRLDAMYEFGAGGKYVRTGVRRDATVYHDQLGQHRDAGISSSLGIIGLDEVGVHLVELAMAHELSTIYVLESEYKRLDPQVRARLEALADVMHEVSRTEAFSVRLVPVDSDELIEHATYTIKTPAAYRDPVTRDMKTRSTLAVHANAVYVNDVGVLDRSFIGLTFGVQGMGRIGEAAVQRALALGANVIVCQRRPERGKYQEKQERLRRLAQDRSRVFGRAIDVEYVDKTELFQRSHILTTLASTTSGTRRWVDREALDLLGATASGPVRIFINAGKGLLNEADLGPYLRQHPEVEVRLDVLSDEQKGGAGQRFLDADGQPVANLKIAGHTAAAVPALRRLKIFNALNNLRLHIDGQRPGNVLNPEVLAE